MSESRPLARLLIDSVRHADAGPAGPLDPACATLSVADLMAAGSLHRITPALAREILRHENVPDAWREPLGAVRTITSVRHLRATEDLRRVQEALEAADIPWMAIKGPVVADSIWPGPCLREYSDIDVVVHPGRLEVALAALEAIGCTYTDRNWPLMARLMRGEVAMTAPLGTPLDLHWHLVVSAALRREFPVDLEAMIERRRPIVLSTGFRTVTLDRTDTVLHLAFHAAQSGAARLMWSADVWFAARALQPTDWRDLRQRAVAARTEVPVSLVIDRATGLLGALGPEDGISSAASRSLWGRLVRNRDRRYPQPGLPGDKHLGGTLFTSARRGTLDSVGRAAHSAWKVRRLQKLRASGHETESEALSRDVPDPVARSEYLRRASEAMAS